MTTNAERAEQCLLAHCTPEQRISWQLYNSIVVRGSAGGTFLLRRWASPQGNRRFLFWQWQEQWCIVNKLLSLTSFPEEDRILGIKLLLEADEWRFRSIGMPLNHAPLWWISGVTLMVVGILLIFFGGLMFDKHALGLIGFSIVFLGASWNIFRLRRMRF